MLKGGSQLLTYHFFSDLHLFSHLQFSQMWWEKWECFDGISLRSKLHLISVNITMLSDRDTSWNQHKTQANGFTQEFLWVLRGETELSSHARALNAIKLCHGCLQSLGCSSIKHGQVNLHTCCTSGSKGGSAEKAAIQQCSMKKWVWCLITLLLVSLTCQIYSLWGLQKPFSKTNSLTTNIW